MNIKDPTCIKGTTDCIERDDYEGFVGREGFDGF